MYLASQDIKQQHKILDMGRNEASIQLHSFRFLTLSAFILHWYIDYIWDTAQIASEIGREVL